REQRIRKRISAERSLMKRQPRGVERHRHVGQHPLQALKFRDWAAELLALLHEGRCLLERPLWEPERDRSGADPLAVISVDEIRKAASKPARRQHQHVFRDFQVLEDDFRFGDAAEAHRGLALADDQAGRTAKREEAADPLLLTALVEYPPED